MNLEQDHEEAKQIIVRNGRIFTDCEYLLGKNVVLIKDGNEEYLVPFNSIEYIKKVKE